MNRLNEYGEIIAEESIKKCGRTYFDGEILWISLSAAGMEFEAYGSFCKISFVGDENAGKSWADAIHTRMAIFVDDKLAVDFIMDEKIKIIQVFHGQAMKRIVRVVKLSEATYSTIGIRGINSDSNICASQGKNLKIEFVGDSITCGYGVDGRDGESSSTLNENASKTYSYLTALELDADYSFVSYSGYGVISGHTENGSKQPERTVPEFYSKFGKSEYSFADGLLPQRIDWNHYNFIADIVVVNLGTNDYFYIGKDTIKAKEFQEGYVDFLRQVRNVNPRAYILCTLGMVGDELYPTIEDAVAVYSKLLKDERISCMKFENQLKEDGHGVMMHPSAITHEKAAGKLISYIRNLDI